MRGRVAVVGAGGFLGRTLVPVLLKEGWHVTALGRCRPAAAQGAVAMACDATRLRDLRQAAAGADAIVNAASAGHTATAAIAGNIAAMLRAGDAGRMIQVSSLSVYGQTRGLLDEDTIPIPVPGHRYARAKRLAELALTVDDLAGRSLILRPGCLYGPGAPVWVDRVAGLLARRRLGQLGPDGEGACHLLHVADAANAIEAAIGSGRAGTVNLLAPGALDWNGYFHLLGAALGLLPLRRLSGLRLAAEAGAATALQAALHGPARAKAGAVTPAMRRLFRGGAAMTSSRPALLPDSRFRPLRDGIAEAALDWRARNAMLRRAASPVAWNLRSAPAS